MLSCPDSLLLFFAAFLLFTDGPVVEYRTFRNDDPPEILKLWHASQLGPSAAEDFPCDILELFVFSQPFFDRFGLILAIDNGRPIGFIHASFGAAPDQSSLDFHSGVISAFVVHPSHRRSGVGAELLSRAEAYLAERGAEVVRVGGGLDGNGFYNGIYGGLQASGFAAGFAPWDYFLGRRGYTPQLPTAVLQRDLTMGRDPVSNQLIRHRRRLNMVVTDRVGDLPWWWHVRFGQLETLKFELQQRHDKTVVCSGQVIGLDVFVSKWGQRSVGIREVSVPEQHRRNGYGLSLVIEICRQLRQQSIQLIEAQIPQDNVAAMELFRAAGFEQVQELIAYRRDL